MTEYLIKLAAALPKEDPNGFDDDELARTLWHEKIEGRESSPRVAVIIYEPSEPKIDKKGVHVVSAGVLRVQPVFTDDSLRAVEAVLLDEYRHQTGAAKMTAEVEFVTRRAFIGLPRTDEEIDRIEAEEQDLMSPTDELRRHLERVHGFEGAHLLTPEELDSKHDAEHDGEMSAALAHERDWIGWTRVDIEAAMAESEDRGESVDLTHGDPELEDIASGPDDERDSVLPVDFSGTRG